MLKVLYSGLRCTLEALDFAVNDPLDVVTRFVNDTARLREKENRGGVAI